MADDKSVKKQNKNETGNTVNGGGGGKGGGLESEVKQSRGKAARFNCKAMLTVQQI